jgi:hypothetical protein
MSTTRNPAVTIVAALAAFVTCFSVSTGQTMLRDWSGVSGPKSVNDQFGISVTALGDADADGVPDAVLTAPLENLPTGTEAGAAYVRSGATSVDLQHEVGQFKQQMFGSSSCVPGDLDGDGVPDYLIGAPDFIFSSTPGKVFAYSGATGATLFKLKGTTVGQHFGVDLAPAGDVDADGIADFCVGANDTGPGSVYLYSGKTQQVLYSFTGSKIDTNMFVGRGLGDLDGDGYGDFGIGAYRGGPNGEGEFIAYSGASGSVLWALTGESYGYGFGGGASSLGDIDGDGIPDVAIASTAYSKFITGAGRVYVYSGGNGSLRWTYDGTFSNEQFGKLPANGRIDFNHDGFADIIIGSPHHNSCFVYSGVTGTLLYEFRGSIDNGWPESLGGAVSPMGDFDGDGIDDILIGAPNNSRNQTSAGRAYVFAGNDLFLQADQSSYKFNDPITIEDRGGAPGSPACIVLTDVSGTPTFLPVAIGTLDGNGNFSVSGTVPAGLSGLTMTFMGYAVKASGHGIADSSPETIAFQ